MNIKDTECKNLISILRWASGITGAALPVSGAAALFSLVPGLGIISAIAVPVLLGLGTTYFRKQVLENKEALLLKLKKGAETGEIEQLEYDKAEKIINEITVSKQS